MIASIKFKFCTGFDGKKKFQNLHKRELFWVCLSVEYPFMDKDGVQDTERSSVITFGELYV
jgi:hypothetical protein